MVEQGFRPTSRYRWLNRVGGRKRAELVARVASRKARRDHLLNLRASAIKVSARKWPVPRCNPHHPDAQQRREMEYREEQLRKEAEHAKERAAAAARVEMLMRLRAGDKNMCRKD
jgi:hypothetical protein